MRQDYKKWGRESKRLQFLGTNAHGRICGEQQCLEQRAPTHRRFNVWRPAEKGAVTVWLAKAGRGAGWGGSSRSSIAHFISIALFY